MQTKIDFQRIANDVNGNPRYVCHFSNLNTQAEKDDYEGLHFVERKYNAAVKRANKIGGRKYTAKSYGGGIVFQSHNLQELESAIERIIERDENAGK